jgi:hypothetical protein
VKNHENIFVLGPTGVGKSYIACALAQMACRDEYSAFYTRAAALFRDLALARADGSGRTRSFWRWARARMRIVFRNAGRSCPYRLKAPIPSRWFQRPRSPSRGRFARSQPPSGQRPALSRPDRSSKRVRTLVAYARVSGPG